jgi:hypothetical protein
MKKNTNKKNTNEKNESNENETKNKKKKSFLNLFTNSRMEKISDFFGSKKTESKETFDDDYDMFSIKEEESMGPEEEYIEKQVKKRIVEYTTEENLKVVVGSYNVASKLPKTSLLSWLNLDSIEAG